MRNRAALLSVVSLALLALVSCSFIMNMSPIASFTALPALGTTPLDVALDATASDDPDGTIASYLWNFGDGQTSSASIFPFTHQFIVQSEQPPVRFRQLVAQRTKGLLRLRQLSSQTPLGHGT